MRHLHNPPSIALVLFTAMALCGSASAQAGSDDCALADPIVGEGSFPFQNVAMTTGADGQDCIPIYNDVWFEWTSTFTGVARIDTCSGTTLDTRLAAYPGGGCPTVGSSIACGWGGCGAQTIIQLPVVSGSTYMLQVGSSAAPASGSGSVTITNVPACPEDVYEPNDDCSMAVPVPPSPATGLWVHGAMNATGVDGDFFIVTVPPGNVLQADVLFTHSGGDIDFYFYDALEPTCGQPNLGQYLVGSSSVSDDESCTWNNIGPVPVDVVMEVLPHGFLHDCNSYDLIWSVTPDACLLAPDDFLEENDTCAAATQMLTGTSQGLFVSQADRDFYRFTVPAGDKATFDATFTHALGNINLNVYDDPGTCSHLIANSFTQTDDESIIWINFGTVAVDLVLEVYVQTGSASACNTYDLTIDSVPNPCSAANDDAFEENDDCFSATPLPNGAYFGLLSRNHDEDHYSMVLQDGETLDVIVYFSQAEADLNLQLIDTTTAGCPGIVIGASSTYTDNEQIQYPNTTGGPLSLVVNIWMLSPGTQDCSTYTLSVLGGGGGNIGTQFCFGDGSDGGFCPCGNMSAVGSGEGCVNGTGVGAWLWATGEPSVSADTLVLTVDQAAPSEFGIFVQNTGIRAVPTPFYNGLFCLNSDAHLVRHYAPPAIMPTVTDATGAGSNAQAMTDGDYLGDTQPGVTTYYQFWGRDNSGPCGVGANFSSGLYLTWLF